MRSLSPTHKNVRAIAEMEARNLAKRPVSANVGDFIATHAGRMWFILLHAVWFSVWIGINLSGQKARIFDPFPFPLLTMIVSLESIFLSLFILMSQNRAGLEADERNHLDLQINLLSEDENTKMLLMLKALCEHHGLAIGSDPEIEAMSQKTDLLQLLTDLRRELPTHTDDPKPAG